MIRKLAFKKSFRGFKVSVLRGKQFTKFRTVVSYCWKTPPWHHLLLFGYLCSLWVTSAFKLCSKSLQHYARSKTGSGSVKHTGLSQVGPKSQEFQQSLWKSHPLLVLHSTGQIPSAPRPCTAPFWCFQSYKSSLCRNTRNEMSENNGQTTVEITFL